MATYSIVELSRREILRMSATLAAANMASTRFAIAQTAEHRTPEQILGPYYPLKGFDQNADLTSVPGRPGRAKGQVLNVMGRVLNLKGEPVRNAKVEIWQANANGRYTHQSETNPVPLDPNFEGAVLLNPKFAKVPARQSCELQVRDTSRASCAENSGLKRALGAAGRPRRP